MVDIKKFTILFLFLVGSLYANIVITNKAKVTYRINSNFKTVFSNEVKFTKINQTKEYQLEFFKYFYGGENYINITDAYYYTTSLYEGKFDPLTQIILSSGQKLNPTKILPTIKTAIFNKKDPIIIVLQDKRANKLSTKKESVKVIINNNQNDKEIIKLFESSEDSGEFIGYINPTTSIQKSNKRDGLIYVFDGAKIDIEVQTTYAKHKIKRVLNIEPTLEQLSQPINEKQDKLVWISHQSMSSNMLFGAHNRFDIELTNLQNYPLENFSIFVKLPKGLKYINNSLKTDGFNGVTFDDDMLSQNILHFKIDNLAQDKIKFSYIANASVTFAKNATIKSWCSKDDNVISNIEKQKLLFKKEFFNDKSFIVGKIISDTKTNLKGIKLYLDNGVSTITDNDGKFHFAGLDNRLYVLQLDTISLDNGMYVKSCINDKKIVSKFVDLQNANLKRVNFCIGSKDQIRKKIDHKDMLKIFQQKVKKAPKMPNYLASDLNKYNKTKWLWPPKTFNPSISSIKVAIAHKVNEKLKLFVNGDEVSLLNYDTLISSNDSSMAITTYRGIDIEKGDNILSANIYSKDNRLLKTIKRKIHFSTSPVKVEFLKKYSYLVADGKNPIIIAVRFYDNDGYPVREDIQGVFKLEEPYKVQQQIKNSLNLNLNSKDTYSIYADGISYIQIAPTTIATQARLYFNFKNQDQVLNVWIKPKPRDWIIVGFGEGTVGYSKIEQNLQLDSDDSFYTDGKLSFFAKGRIKGDMLLTIAYDSSKSKNTPLFDAIKPDEYYTIYQDNSTQSNETTSQRKLYLKIEKEQFYALFGDINSDLQINELSKYKRVLNGFKSEYHVENFSYKAFISDSKNIFIKDEIRSDGSSGAYHLKYKNIVPYSEKVYIEVRDRLREEIVLSRVPMKRFFDYSIDFDDGTLYFQNPLFSTDFNANPRYIVIDYEIKSNGVSNLIYGGRAAIKFQNQKVETGLTYIKEDLGVDQKNLQGIDTKIKLSNNLKINAEYAITDHLISSQKVRGDAYLLEMIYHSNLLKATGYFRNQTNAFGLEQENQILRHSQKMGLDMRWDYFKRVAILMSAYSDKNLLNDSKKDDFELSSEYKKNTLIAKLGYRYTLGDQQKDSRFLTTIQKRFLQNRFNLKASYEYSLNNPNRNQIEARYAVNSFVDIFFLNEIYSDEYKNIHTSLGLQTVLWKNTELRSSVINSYQDNQKDFFTKLGLKQTYQLNQAITLMGAIEQKYKLSGTFNDDKQDEFSSYTGSINYNANPWSGNFQAQFRDSKSATKLLLDFGIYNQFSQDIGLLYGMRFNSLQDNNKTTQKFNTNFASAYRPFERWLLINRLDLIYETNSQKTNSKFINNLILNYQPKNNIELSLQHGFKYMKEQLDEKLFDTVIDFINIHILYQLSKKYDISTHLGFLHDYSNQQIVYVYGLQTGYKIEQNSWFGIGYNIKGFKDNDFYTQNETNQGPYIRFRMKFDQHNLKSILTKIR